jgi:L-iditol 2-dehydrogenase
MFRVPEELPTEVAVLAELMSVTHSLDLAARLPRPGGFRSGDTVAVVGIGPLGLVHVAKAALLGAGRVVAIDPVRSRLDLALELGADEAALPDEAVDFEADVVVDASGHPDTFLPSLALARDGGTVVEVGAFVDLGTRPLNPAVLCGRNLTLLGVGGEDARAYEGTLRLLARHHRSVPFERAVTHRFPLDRAREAMEAAFDPAASMKVVIEPNGRSA